MCLVLPHTAPEKLLGKDIFLPAHSQAIANGHICPLISPCLGQSTTSPPPSILNHQVWDQGGDPPHME